MRAVEMAPRVSGGVAHATLSVSVSLSLQAPIEASARRRSWSRCSAGFDEVVRAVPGVFVRENLGSRLAQQLGAVRTAGHHAFKS